MKVLEATWSTRCTQDPRFSLSGDGGVREMSDALLAKKKELGLSTEEMHKLRIEPFFWSLSFSRITGD
jgi:hypothetical protein